MSRSELKIEGLIKDNNNNLLQKHKVVYIIKND